MPRFIIILLLEESFLIIMSQIFSRENIWKAAGKIVLKRALSGDYKFVNGVICDWQKMNKEKDEWRQHS